MYAFLLSLMLFTSMVNEKTTVTLNVEIINVKVAKGKLMVAIYRPDEKFGAGTPAIARIVEVRTTGGQTTSFDMEPGEYALAAYHDVNGNEQLDKNFVGIPKEPYGFSKNFRPKFSAPSFKDCAFKVTSESVQKISVKLAD